MEQNQQQSAAPKAHRSSEQILDCLREQRQSKLTVKEYCQANAISQNTFYRWQKIHGKQGKMKHKKKEKVEGGFATIGRSSEKASTVLPGQLSLGIDAELVEVCNINDGQKIESYTKIKSEKKKHPGRNEIPAHLERKYVDIHPENLPADAEHFDTIETEQLEYDPARLFATVYRRHKYKRSSSTGTEFFIASLPEEKDKSLAAPSLKAHVTTEKFMWHSVLRMSNVSKELVQCFAKDEGRPLEIGLQELVSNHIMLHRLNAFVVSDNVKVLKENQVSLQETTEKEPPMKCRKCTGDVKTGQMCLARDKLEGYLFTALMASGTEAA